VAATLGKLYTNALLVLINSRRRQLTHGDGLDYVWPEDEHRSRHLPATATINTNAPISVEINVEHETHDNVAMVTFDKVSRCSH
jgi:hypothetical protein